MENHYQVIIVGGGQAGLSVAYGLQEKGIKYIIFEKNEIASSWKNKRWDKFCLVTPNFQCRLPGYSYSGDDPEGFMQKDEIVDFVKGYAATFNPNIKEGVEVIEVSKNEQSIFEVTTSLGAFTSEEVVIAAGNFHSPIIPPVAKKMDPSIKQLHSSEYKNPEQLEEGEILVVGTGQSGCQIAEDLHLAGKKVHLAVGDAPRSPRRYRGKDVVQWLEEMGYYDIAIEDHPDGLAVRKKTNHYLTGRDGGKEIDLRQFALEGMQLYGLLTDADKESFSFGTNLEKDLDKADTSYERIKAKIDSYIDKKGIKTAEKEPVYKPVWKPDTPVTSLDNKETNITTVIWCIGWGFDFSWIKLPILDEKGYPEYNRGVTKEKGLYFIGMAWMHTWGSGRFSGIAPDAEYLGDYIAESLLVSKK